MSAIGTMLGLAFISTTYSGKYVLTARGFSNTEVRRDVDGVDDVEFCVDAELWDVVVRSIFGLLSGRI